MKIQIIFSTEVGTTKYVAERIQKTLTELGHQADVYEVGIDGYQPVLEGYDLQILGSPTYYGGQLETKMAQFVIKFNPDFSHTQVAVFSLGDRNYQDFCGSADILEKWVSDHGGKVVVPSLKIDGYPDDLVPISAWVTGLVKEAGL